MKRPDIEGMEERLTAATHGPWSTTSEWSVRASDDELVAHACAYVKHEADAEFIARARQDIPELIAYVKSLEVLLKVREAAQIEEMSFAGDTIASQLRSELEQLMRAFGLSEKSVKRAFISDLSVIEDFHTNDESDEKFLRRVVAAAAVLGLSPVFSRKDKMIDVALRMRSAKENS